MEENVLLKDTGLDEEPRIGVYVCHCGLNIAQTVDCRQVAETASATRACGGVQRHRLRLF